MPKVSPFVFVLAVAAVLPLAGVVLAIVRFSEKRTTEAQQLLLAAVFGVFAWLLVLNL